MCGTAEVEKQATNKVATLINTDDLKGNSESEIAGDGEWIDRQYKYQNHKLPVWIRYNGKVMEGSPIPGDVPNGDKVKWSVTHLQQKFKRV